MIGVVVINTTINFFIAIWEAIKGFKRGAIVVYRSLKQCSKKES